MKKDRNFEWVHGVTVPFFFLIIGLQLVIIGILMYLWFIFPNNNGRQENVRRADVERGFIDSLRSASERIHEEVCFSFVCVRCRLNNFQYLDKTFLF